MGFFDFLTNGFPPAHEEPIRYLPHKQPIGDCGMWQCVGCEREYKHCKCDHDLGRRAKWWEC